MSWALPPNGTPSLLPFLCQTSSHLFPNPQLVPTLGPLRPFLDTHPSHNNPSPPPETILCPHQTRSPPLGSRESAACDRTSDPSGLDQKRMLDPGQSRLGSRPGSLGLLGGLGKRNPGLQGEVGTELGRQRTGKLDKGLVSPLPSMSPIHMVGPSCSLTHTPGYFWAYPPENPGDASESCSPPLLTVWVISKLHGHCRRILGWPLTWT